MVPFASIFRCCFCTNLCVNAFCRSIFCTCAKASLLATAWTDFLETAWANCLAIISLRCSFRSCACWATSAMARPGRRAGDDAWTSVPKAVVRFAGAEDGRCRCCAATSDAARLNLYLGEQSVQTGGFGFWPSNAAAGLRLARRLDFGRRVAVPDDVLHAAVVEQDALVLEAGVAAHRWRGATVLRAAKRRRALLLLCAFGACGRYCARAREQAARIASAASCGYPWHPCDLRQQEGGR